jgi:hypothetical protein
MQNEGMNDRRNVKIKRRPRNRVKGREEYTRKKKVRRKVLTD